jgi:hypothetical protein
MPVNLDDAPTGCTSACLNTIGRPAVSRARQGYGHGPLPQATLKATLDEIHVTDRVVTFDHMDAREPHIRIECREGMLAPTAIRVHVGGLHPVDRHSTALGSLCLIPKSSAVRDGAGSRNGVRQASGEYLRFAASKTNRRVLASPEQATALPLGSCHL